MEECQGEAPVGLGPLDGHGVIDGLMDGLLDGVADGMQELEDGIPEGLIAPLLSVGVTMEDCSLWIYRMGERNGSRRSPWYTS